MPYDEEAARREWDRFRATLPKSKSQRRRVDPLEENPLDFEFNRLSGDYEER